MAFNTGFWEGGLVGTAERMNYCLLGWGPFGDFPAASADNKGALALATDKGTVYHSDGTDWVQTAIVPPGSLVQGDIIYWNGTAWTRLPPGTAGQVLTTNGAGANPAWGTVASGGATMTQPSRNFSITYQNTTGKVMFVAVSVNLDKATNMITGGGANLRCGPTSSNLSLVGSVSLAVNVTGWQGYIDGTMSAIIPPGYYYRADTTSGINIYLTSWTEWTLG